ncbi:hypothetical protein EJB05_11110, partial [Eragrostis curvula]
LRSRFCAPVGGQASRSRRKTPKPPKTLRLPRSLPFVSPAHFPHSSPSFSSPRRPPELSSDLHPCSAAMEAARLAQEQERSLYPRFLLMVMLYPTVLVFSLAGRTGSLWPLTPLITLRVAAGAEDNTTVLLFTAAFAVTISLVNVGLVCHMTACRALPPGVSSGPGRRHRSSCG